MVKSGADIFGVIREAVEAEAHGQHSCRIYRDCVLDADRVHLAIEEIRPRVAGLSLQRVASWLLAAIVQIVEISQPSGRELVRDLTVELVSTVPQRIAAVEVRHAVASLSRVRHWISLQKLQPDRINVGYLVAGIVAASRKVLDADRICTVSALRACPGCDRSDLRKIAATLQRRRNHERGAVDER